MHNTKTSGNGNRKEDMSKLSKLNIQLGIMFPEKKKPKLLLLQILVLSDKIISCSKSSSATIAQSIITTYQPSTFIFLVPRIPNFSEDI